MSYRVRLVSQRAEDAATLEATSHAHAVKVWATTEPGHRALDRPGLYSLTVHLIVEFGDDVRTFQVDVAKAVEIQVRPL